MESPVSHRETVAAYGLGIGDAADFAPDSPDAQPLVVVSVGTDHHPFDRLVGCMDRWAAEHPTARVVIQRGSAAETQHAESHTMIPHAELLELFEAASAVVTHGGPSTIMDVRAVGHSPIVFPRNPAHGEHVDNHQLRFGQHLARHQMAAIVYESHELTAAVNEALIAPERYRIDTETEPAAGVVAFGRVVDELLGIKTAMPRPKRGATGSGAEPSVGSPTGEERRR